MQQITAAASRQGMQYCQRESNARGSAEWGVEGGELHVDMSATTTVALPTRRGRPLQVVVGDSMVACLRQHTGSMLEWQHVLSGSMFE
jgi:hypothetical protein